MGALPRPPRTQELDAIARELAATFVNGNRTDALDGVLADGNTDRERAYLALSVAACLANNAPSGAAWADDFRRALGRRIDSEIPPGKGGR